MASLATTARIWALLASKADAGEPDCTDNVLEIRFPFAAVSCATLAAIDTFTVWPSIGLTVKEYTDPLPVKPVTVPDVVVISPTKRPVTASEKVAVTVKGAVTVAVAVVSVTVTESKNAAVGVQSGAAPYPVNPS